MFEVERIAIVDGQRPEKRPRLEYGLTVDIDEMLRLRFKRKRDAKKVIEVIEKAIEQFLET